MRKAEPRKKPDEMRAEYDFSKGVRGKYAKRYAAGTNVVVLDADVAKIFDSSEAVNTALRSLADLAKRSARGRKKKAS